MPRRSENYLFSRAGVHKIVEILLREATDKLDVLVINVAEQTVFDALETCDVDENKTFTKSALKSALIRLQLFSLDDLSGNGKSFGDAIYIWHQSC